MEQLMIEGTKLDADKSLAALGSLGRFQIRVFLLGNSCNFFTAMQMMLSAFVASQPPFNCYQMLQQPPGNRTWVSRCTINGTNSEISCGTNQTVFQYDSSFGNTIVSEWQLVCDRKYLADLSSSFYMFGFLVGSLMAPMASDRWGRRRPLLACLLLLATIATLISFSPSYWIFSTLRFSEGIFAAGVGVIAFVCACEVMVPEKRTWNSAAGGITWVLGYCTVGFVAWGFPDWRAMTLAIGLPVWVTGIYYFLMPESLHWYVAKDKTDDAKNWIVRAAKHNKTNVQWEDCFSGAVNPMHKKTSFLQGLKSPVLLIHTGAMAYIWFANSFIYYGLSLFTASLAGNRYVNYLLSGLVELPAYFAVAFLFNCIGRKKTLTVFHFLAFLGLATLPFLPQNMESPMLTTIVWLFGKFCVTLTFMGVWMFAAEIFPTTVRSSGVGVCSVAARAGGILAPFVGSLAEYGEAFPPLVFGGMSLLAAVFVLILPETNNKKLPDDLDDLEPGPIIGLFYDK